MSQKIQSIRGMEDVLPEASPLWEKFEDACRAVFEQYGYRNIRTPIVEMTALFVRGIGEVTDIVEKEMYVFEDRGGDSIALRPEATAGIVRSAIEHNFLYNGPMRVWTQGAMFRYERPQKGRQREFHQFDVEALGFEGPDVDAEQMVMLARLWKKLGLQVGPRDAGGALRAQGEGAPLALDGEHLLLDDVGNLPHRAGKQVRLLEQGRPDLPVAPHPRQAGGGGFQGFPDRDLLGQDVADAPRRPVGLGLALALVRHGGRLW